MPKNQHTRDPDPIISRIASLETGYRSLAEDVSRLAGLVREQGKQLTDAIETLRDKFVEQTSPKWGTYIAALTLVLMFMGSVGGMAVAPLYLVTRTLHDASLELKENQIRHFDEPGHDTAMERMRNLEAQVAYNGAQRDKRIAELDETLQREMRLLQAGSEAALQKADESLQREMRLLNESQDVKTAEIDRRLGAIDSWTTDHDTRVVGLNAAQWERIKALEREVYGKPRAVDHGGPQGSTSNE